MSRPVVPIFRGQLCEQQVSGVDVMQQNTACSSRCLIFKHLHGVKFDHNG